MNAAKPQPIRWEDRRIEARHKANGVVTLRLNEEFQGFFEATLLDISVSGFRAEHHNAVLRSGQECDFMLPGTRGKARVVWNKITPEHTESGFLILAYETA